VLSERPINRRREAPSFRQDRRNPDAKDGNTRHRRVSKLKWQRRVDGLNRHHHIRKIAVRGNWIPVSIQE